MSTFVERTVVCPSCGAEQTRSIATSINADRSAAVTASIVENRFQRFACASCGHGYVVDDPFLYLDFTQKLFLFMFPKSEEPRWRQVQETPMDLYRNTLVENAPPIAAALGQGMCVRAVFGLRALSEKIQCFAAGLRDVDLEVCKLRLLREQAGQTALDPEHRPTLHESCGDDLVFALPTKPEQNRYRLYTVAKSTVRQLADDPAWQSIRKVLAESAYVDIGKLLMPAEMG